MVNKNIEIADDQIDMKIDLKTWLEFREWIEKIIKIDYDASDVRRGIEITFTASQACPCELSDVEINNATGDVTNNLSVSFGYENIEITNVKIASKRN